MSFRTTLALTGAFASAVMAHGRIEGISIDGTYQSTFLGQYYYENQNTGSFPDNAGWYAEDTDNGFVSPDSYGAADIICHKAAKPGAIAAKASPGSTISFHWNQDWPESHMGPLLTYVAEYTGASSDIDKTALKWVKIDESGYDAATSTFASPAFIANNATWDTVVPSNLKAGSYVFRHEIIALHGAGSENGAQNYPQCFNIDIDGSGTELPEGTLGTALYTPTDPGILFNPYQAFTSYEIPGPALMAGAGSGSTSSATPSSTATAAASSTAAAATTTSSSVATTTAPVAAEATPTSSSAPSTGSDSSSLPETFTIDQFITWLQGATGGSVTRRHAREMLRRFQI
ncbi:hypothetical protein SLS62_008327 [Diatrype stigma]|uniref:lytic cellulose monooxygenase (C4-dehydrogenating) n=1 Tax=Diatrype stigma TaxID=117547 RepID=A0AAN9UKM1_9PEZI